MKLKIIETPRDAMQGLKTFVPTEAKIRYIQQLLEIGFYAVDVGSFVSPKAIPQMADTSEVLNGLDFSKTTSRVMVTIANLRGAEKAMQFPVIDEIAFPYSVSEEFLRRNINSDKAKALDTVSRILELCSENHKELILYNSMAFGNAYGEIWSPEIVAEDMFTLEKMGVKTVILSDTVDLGLPDNIHQTFDLIMKEFPRMEIGAHLHTTENDWRSHVEAAWDSGCRRFDGVLNGLGGCPMSGKKLVGNLSTKHIVQFLDEKKIEHSLDLEAFKKALFLSSLLPVN
ncbi:MAG: hypothetical protein JXR34_11155 [Bacteroidales bacterium]|nr:hypothetical protein [Bacteroidales bacterium]